MSLTLYNLENSRSIRVHWLALELKAPVKTRNYKRVGGKAAVPEMAKDMGVPGGKSPALIGEDENGKRMVIVETTNCMLYLAEKYGKNSSLLPDPPAFGIRTQIIGWIDFSETVVTHALVIVYGSWFSEGRPEDAAAIENLQTKASAAVQTDLDLIEQALSGGQYVCGSHFTAADIALAFSCEFVLVNQIGTKGHATGWPKIQAWLKTIEKRDAYQQALKEGPDYQFCLLNQAK